MTIEEKYNKALEWMRGVYPTLTGAAQEDAEHFFPELKESEDERIRKFLIDILSQGTWRKEWPFGPNKVVAWLERQSQTQSDTEKEYVRTLQSLIMNFLHGKDEVDRDYYQQISDWLEERHVEQKVQRPTFLRPHNGNDNNHYDMGVFEAQTYAINRGLDIPFNDGEVFIDDRYMTQTVGNILRWADEHPKEQNFIQTEEEKEYIRIIKSLIADFIRDKKPEDVAYYQRIYNWLDGRHIEQKPVEINEYEIIKKHITEDSLSSEVNKRLKECGWYVTDEKPAERQDYSCLNELEGAIHRGFLSAGVENVPVAIIKETEQECLAQMKLAEWSEEDEIRRESCMLYLANTRDCIEFNQHIGDNARESGKKEIQKDIDWLKSLRPKPTEKINEEDKYHIERIISYLGTLQRINAPHNKPIIDEIEWLKAFRPNFYPHLGWKPSKEQMDALDSAINYLTEHTYTPGNSLLISLFTDLQKLP